MYKQLTYNRGGGLQEYTFPVYEHGTNLPSTNLYTSTKWGTRVKPNLSADDSTFTSTIGDKTKEILSEGFNYAMFERDLREMPNYYKNIGSLGQAIIDSSGKIYSRLDKVDDFESCAQYYHRNGYLVNEYVDDEGALLNQNIFSYVNTRYFFNVVKLSEVDVHLDNVIESEELTARIAARLMKGLRLWNYNAKIDDTQTIGIGNFIYDNVEKDYITN